MSETEQPEPNAEIVSRNVASATKTRVAGVWLVLGSLLLVVSLALHPPPSPDLGEFMAIIADNSTLWVAVHWGAAFALTMLVIAGLLVLTAGSRLTQTWWTMSAWAVLIIGALWVTTTAVAEATVIATAATAGDMATFEAWQGFADGKAIGFGFLVAALAVIAVDEARSVRSLTPTWAAWIGTIAAVVAFVAFVLGLVLGIAIGAPIWLISTIVVGLWTLWFGVGLVRSESVEAQPQETELRSSRVV